MNSIMFILLRGIFADNRIFCLINYCKLVNLFDKRKKPSYTLLYIGIPKGFKNG